MIYIITYILNLFDLTMTTYWVRRYGIEIEANPIGRWLYQTGVVYPVKIIGVGALLLLLHKAIEQRDTGLETTTQWWDVIKWVVFAAYAALAIYHVIIAIRVHMI